MCWATDRSGSTSVSAAPGMSTGNSPPPTWLTSSSPALGVARPRLGELYGLAVVDRLRPRADMSSAPSHWVLGSVGAALMAAERGVKTVDLERRKGMLSDLAASQRLAHLVGTNSVPTSPRPLRPGYRLEVWWSEQRCTKESSEIVRPDGYGIWIDHDLSPPLPTPAILSGEDCTPGPSVVEIRRKGLAK